jgi:hypothetical protein
MGEFLVISNCDLNKEVENNGQRVTVGVCLIEDEPVQTPTIRLFQKGKGAPLALCDEIQKKNGCTHCHVPQLS